MKKTISLLIALAATLAAPAWAAKFNPDAMKSMQEQGLKVSEEAQGLAPLKAVGKCLSAQSDNAKAGTGVSMAACKDKSAQRWRFDDAGHLVNGGGLCLTVSGDKAQLGDCGGAAGWSQDGQGRITSGGKCLTAGAKDADMQACGPGDNQAWQ